MSLGEDNLRKLQAFVRQRSLAEGIPASQLAAQISGSVVGLVMWLNAEFAQEEPDSIRGDTLLEVMEKLNELHLAWDDLPDARGS